MYQLSPFMQNALHANFCKNRALVASDCSLKQRLMVISKRTFSHGQRHNLKWEKGGGGPKHLAQPLQKKLYSCKCH